MCEAISIPAAVQLLALLILNIPVFRLLFPLFYDTKHQFLDDLALAHQPGWLSLLRGELIEDVWAEFRLMFYAIVCALPVGVEFMLARACLS